ncbi:MAG TPA: hypothetical protein VNZ26_22880 [Vicinamibacterales bacterium]|jgi:hypothetical protein|nr:hypothetical protein [Vicinamibacterales bacterium]
MNDHQGSVSEGQTTGDGPFARLGAEIDHLLRSVIPPDDVCEHFTNARVEVLKGIRAIIDARITSLSSQEKKGVSIKVE